MTATRTHTVLDSPIGDLTLVNTDGVLSGLYMAEHRPEPDRAAFGPRTNDGFAQVVTELGEYFAGERTAFTVPISPVGTEFQRQVWEALRSIDYGTTCTYGELAHVLGRPSSVRAVANANSRNPMSIIVPCHRVIGSSGKLTGYAGGLERKQFLLDAEARVLAARRIGADAPEAPDASV